PALLLCGASPVRPLGARGVPWRGDRGRGTMRRVSDPSTAVDEILKRFPSEPARTLVLGGTGPLSVDEATRVHPPRSLDRIVSIDHLGGEEWDRWALQRMHRLLREGGDLVLSAPNVLSLASPLDAPRLGGAAREERGTH